MAQYCIHDLNYRRIGGPSRTLIVVGYEDLPENVMVAIENDDFGKFLANDAIVQDYSKKVEGGQHPQQLMKLEFVLAKNDATNRYYRCGYIEEVDDENVKVYSIDWEFSFTTQKKNIRVNT